MPDGLEPADEMVVSQLRGHVSGVVARRDPQRVVADVIASSRRRTLVPRLSRMIWGVAAAVVLVIVIAVSAGVSAYFGSETSSRIATAVVNDLQYVVSGARSLHLPPEVLTPYGEATQMGDDQLVDGLTVYAVRGIDPKQILVIKLKAGTRDDVGPLGDYFLLWRGGNAVISEICPYFDRTSDATPQVCR